jgi:hypothetical protein
LFRQPLGYEVSMTDRQVNIYSEQTGIVISLIGIKTRKHGPVEDVLDGLLKELESQFEELTVSDLYSNPIDGFEGLAVPITGSYAGSKVSGLVAVISIDDQQLFYIVALIPDGPEGPAWNIDGRPVLETLIRSIDFFPPVGQ